MFIYLDQKYGLSSENCAEKSDLIAKIREAHVQHQAKACAERKEKGNFGFWVRVRC